MPTHDFQPVSMREFAAGPNREPPKWLWNGYLAPGDVTLLTSQWKTGKTTLLAGLLQHLGTGTPFLGRGTRPAKVWVVSEESHSQWGERLRLMPVDTNAHLLARSFRGRPSPGEWNALIDRAIEAGPELFVVDPLAPFLTGRCESDAATLLEALQPLRRLTAAGMAVLLLHHPRKKPSEVGSSARGSGALLGFVDTALEMTRCGKLKSDAHRRLIHAQSRRAETPARLAYEWDPATGAFAEATDPRDWQFEENWQTVRGILEGRGGAITHKEIAEFWPDDSAKPSKVTLYSWLNLAFGRKLVRRDGQGTNTNPWRYRVENADDESRERGERPPPRPLVW